MWNIGYSEVLKMDKKNHFQKLSDSVNGKELEEILSEFFNIVETGVHILILCSNQPEKISKEELTELLKKNHPERIINITDCYTRKFHDQNSDAVGIITDCVSVMDTMRKIFSYIENAVETENTKFESICSYIEQGQKLEEPVSDKIGYGERSAKKISDMWTVKGKWLPEIRLIVYLPGEYFECFTDENNYFPIQMEYAVQIITRDQWREKLLKETFDENRKLRNENKELRNENKELKREKEDWKGKCEELEQENMKLNALTTLPAWKNTSEVLKTMSLYYGMTIKNKIKNSTYDAEYFMDNDKLGTIEITPNKKTTDSEEG